MRLIDADEMLLNTILTLQNGRMKYAEDKLFVHYLPGYEELFKAAVRDARTVDAKAVAQGEWVRLDAHKGMEQFKCSVCRSECYVPTCMNEPMYDYCPNCGAKMDGDGNG